MLPPVLSDVLRLLVVVVVEHVLVLGVGQVSCPLLVLKRLVDLVLPSVEPQLHMIICLLAELIDLSRRLVDAGRHALD